MRCGVGASGHRASQRNSTDNGMTRCKHNCIARNKKRDCERKQTSENTNDKRKRKTEETL